jgi:aminopeptidase N
VLSTNTYQKGGWVLHMLRHEVGDQNFWKGIRQYYARYRNSNAMTNDFQGIMEDVAGKSLDDFFMQWLYRPGHPKISGKWHFDPKSKSVEIELTQTQEGIPFKFPLDIGVTGKDGKMEVKTVSVTAKSQKFTIPAAAMPNSVVADPNTWLLFEGTITQK